MRLEILLLDLMENHGEQQNFLYVLVQAMYSPKM